MNLGEAKTFANLFRCNVYGRQRRRTVLPVGISEWAKGEEMFVILNLLSIAAEQITTNLVAQSTSQLLSHSLDGSGIWAQLGWVLYLNRLPSGVGQS